MNKNIITGLYAEYQVDGELARPLDVSGGSVIAGSIAVNRAPYFGGPNVRRVDRYDAKAQLGA